MGKLQGSWIWYELFTSHAQGSKAFYEAVVGWSITLDAVPVANSDTAYALIGNDDGGKTGGMLTITPQMAAAGARPMWVGYIAVDDCAAMLEVIVARGGRVLMPLTALDVGTVAMVMDPAGAPFYIMTPIPPKDAAGPSTAYARDMIGRCGWNELYTQDQPRTVDFYTELFGWSLPGSMDMGDFGTYQFIGRPDATGEDTAMGAIMTCPPHAPIPHWNHYFRVADIPTAQHAIEAHGGKVVHGPMPVPGGEWILNGVDPQGAHFCLVGASAAREG